MLSVPELDRPSPGCFQQEVYPSGQPVVMRGIARDWHLVRKALESPEALAASLTAAAGSRPVDVLRGRQCDDRTFFYTDDLAGLNFERGSMPFADFLAELVARAEDDGGRTLYLQATRAASLAPSLVDDLPLAHAPPLAEPYLWVGNGTTAQTHFDLSQNIAVVVSGRRRFTLFPPAQTPNLYMGPVEMAPFGTPVSLVRIDRPDYGRFPRFAEAERHALVADLEPGDAIFIPYMWWHHVEATGRLNLLVNYWWNEYDVLGSPMHAMLHAILTMRDMKPAMREGWKAMFDTFVFEQYGPAAKHIPAAMQGALGPIDGATRLNLWHSLGNSMRAYIEQVTPRRGR